MGLVLVRDLQLLQGADRPGRAAADYFQPSWYDTDGRHIQAHGGQIVTAQENGEEVQYWYGEDRSNGYGSSPGVHVYSSRDLYSWTDEGLALRALTTAEEIDTDPYFLALYDGYSEEQKAASLGSDSVPNMAGTHWPTCSGVPFALAPVGAEPLRALCCLPVGAQARMPGGEPFTPPWAV